MNVGTVDTGAGSQNININNNAATGVGDLLVTYTTPENARITVNGQSGNGSVTIDADWGQSYNVTIDGNSSYYGRSYTHKTSSTPSNNVDQTVSLELVSKQGSYSASDIKSAAGTPMNYYVVTESCFSWKLDDSFSNSHLQSGYARKVNEAISKYGLCGSQTTGSADVVISYGRDGTTNSYSTRNGVRVVTSASMHIAGDADKEIGRRFTNISTTNLGLYNAVKAAERDAYSKGINIQSIR